MDYKIITHCRACGNEMHHLKENTFSFGIVPLAGNFCKTQERSATAEKYPLSLVCCPSCETVQVLHDVDDKILFSEYNYASSTVGGLNRHFVQYAEFLKKVFSDKNHLSFLEIGCNDGVLLKKLPDTWTKIGVDPSDVALQNVDSSYSLYNEPFSKGMVEKNRLTETCDVISGSNCLAHISDIKDVFEGIWLALKKSGSFFIEVHDLFATINGDQWDTLYHEHKIEWDIKALSNSLIPLGFEFIHVDYLPLHGGLIRAHYKKTNKPVSFNLVKDKEKLSLLNKLHSSYLKRYDKEVIRLLAKQNIVAYGASGRAVMFLNHMSDLKFSQIVDESEIRIGKYIPVVQTKVIDQKDFHEQKFDYCLVTAWNYFDDIVKKNDFFKGKWVKYFDY